MRERFETKSKSNLLKEIEDILADATQSELSSIKESMVDRRNSMRTGKTQMEELGSTQSTQSTVSTTMLKQNMDLDPLGKNLDSHGFSSNQSRPLINDDEKEAKLSSNNPSHLAKGGEPDCPLHCPRRINQAPSSMAMRKRHNCLHTNQDPSSMAMKKRHKCLHINPPSLATKGRHDCLHNSEDQK